VDKSREGFEAWASDNGASPRAIHRGTNGGYLLMSTFTAWEAWQASRAAVVVELPKDVTNVTNKAYEEGRDDVITAIGKAGITVKGDK